MKMPKNEDNNLKKEFKDPKKNQNKKAYIALGACLIIVSAVAWSTYQSVNTFISPFTSNSSDKKSNKFSKNKESDTGKVSILDEKNSLTDAQPKGKTIPYGKPKEAKQKNDDNSPQKTQAVSASPANLQTVYPVDGNNIWKEFSGVNPVYSNTMGDWRTHEGTDFKAEIGEKVKSIAEGTVKDVYQDASYGTTVVIEHGDGFTAYYSGLSEKALIEKGKKVKSGDEIGTIGKVPCETADLPHLHLSINKGDKFIDPMLILDKETH